VARTLYDELFRRAAAEGVPMIGCEVNSDPPNPASDAFHERLGFAEVGRAALPGGTKLVRYLSRPTSNWPG
jgi:predicted GNAT superfamily acetyltransferase